MSPRMQEASAQLSFKETLKIGPVRRLWLAQLVSIFGDNFGFTGSNFATGTLNAFSQYPTSLTVVPGKTPVNLSVAFKDGKNTFNAPILFANENQINLAVPAGLTNGDTVTIAVTSGTASSDGLFQANVATNDPGIFTLTSDGTGQGAIINHDGTINSQDFFDFLAAFFAGC